MGEEFAHHDALIHHVTTDGYTVVAEDAAATFAVRFDNRDVEGTTTKVKHQGPLVGGGGAGIGHGGGVGFGQKGELGQGGQLTGFAHAVDGDLVVVGVV